MQPTLLLADEPTGNLDEISANELITLLLELVAEAGSSLLMVTHSQQLAQRLDRQVVLRLGRVQQAAPA